MIKGEGNSFHKPRDAVQSGSKFKRVGCTIITYTFMAPLVAIALSEIPVRKVHKPHNATNNKDSPMPAIPTILQVSQTQKI